MADNNKTLIDSPRYPALSARSNARRHPVSSQTARIRVGQQQSYPGERIILSSNEKQIVAVVDDDLGIRVSLSVLLKAIGFDAETFDSAEAFLKAAPNSMAGCLLVDIQLGDISGIELTRQLSEEGFKFPIIFISALDDAQVRRQVDASGCVAFLIKPFASELLVDAITKATGWSIKMPLRDVDT
jgi:CheY-like chemotaxis protein